MCTAWSRSFEPSGSIVTNGTSVASDRSPSGPRPITAAASASTSGGNSAGMSSSCAQLVEPAADEDVDGLLLRLLRRAGMQLDVASGHAASLGGPRRHRASVSRTHPDPSG